MIPIQESTTDTTAVTGSEAGDEQERIKTLAAKNERLGQALQAASQKLRELDEQLRALHQPPLSHAVYLGRAGDQLQVGVGNRVMNLSHSANLAINTWRVGQRVLVNEAMMVTGRARGPVNSQVATVGEVLADGRLLVSFASGGQGIVLAADDLEVSAGETVAVDANSFVALEKITRRDVEQLLTPQLPKTRWEDIGGLDNQIEAVRDAIELPFTHPELYERFGLRPPRGILLYGPPGCGKTMIAQAVARSIASSQGGRGYFLSVKGPELLNKFVGETERQIRAIFARARQLASPTSPVVIFFDEMEALFKTRGSGISSDMETLIVPQLLAELDGVDRLANVIVIGASNRADMIDPAVLRPGRLDIQIQIERPDAASATQIAALHLSDDLPVGEESPQQLRTKLVAALYARTEANFLGRMILRDGSAQPLYLGDLVTGAIIAAVVEIAKKNAIKRAIKGSEVGLIWDDIAAANESMKTSVRSTISGTDSASVARTLSLNANTIERIEVANRAN